jgi:hypothetical protein
LQFSETLFVKLILFHKYLLHGNSLSEKPANSKFYIPHSINHPNTKSRTTLSFTMALGILGHSDFEFVSPVRHCLP